MAFLARLNKSPQQDRQDGFTQGPGYSYGVGDEEGGVTITRECIVGHEIFTAILDTGSTINVVTKQAAERM